MKNKALQGQSDLLTHDDIISFSTIQGIFCIFMIKPTQTTALDCLDCHGNQHSCQGFCFFRQAEPAYFITATNNKIFHAASL